MTLTVDRPTGTQPLDAISEAIAAAQPQPATAPEGEVKNRDLVLIWYSGDLE